MIINKYKMNVWNLYIYIYIIMRISIICLNIEILKVRIFYRLNIYVDVSIYIVLCIYIMIKLVW